MGTELIQSIAIFIIAASALAFLAYKLHQPLILGYIVAGIIIGSELGFGFVKDAEAIEGMSELGLIMLFFIIGLEIEIKKLLQSSWAILIIGVTQFVFCVALGLGFFSLPWFDDGGTYGDLENPDTLVRCGIDKARIVVSTIPDHILKGTSNMNLLIYTKRVNPKAKVVVTAESIPMAQKLYKAGAEYVLLPRLGAASKLSSLLEELVIQETSIPAWRNAAGLRHMAVRY